MPETADEFRAKDGRAAQILIMLVEKEALPQKTPNKPRRNSENTDTGQRGPSQLSLSQWSLRRLSVLSAVKGLPPLASKIRLHSHPTKNVAEAPIITHQVQGTDVPSHK